MSFSGDIRTFRIESDKLSDRLVRAISLELFTRVVKKSRVRTGRFRGNWQTSTGSPVSKEIDRLDTTGGRAISEAASKVKGAGSVNFLSNNVPYAGVLEERYGAVRVAMVEVDQIVRQKLNAIR